MATKAHARVSRGSTRSTRAEGERGMGDGDKTAHAAPELKAKDAWEMVTAGVLFSAAGATCRGACSASCSQQRLLVTF